MQNKTKRLFALYSVVFICSLLFIGLMGVGCSNDQPLSLADQLPESVEVLETFSDTSGMDAFFLVKGRFKSNEDIVQVCHQFRLLPAQSDVSELSFAGIWDERSNISWFPLENVSRRFAFCSVNPDGTWKENVTGRYENVLWVDDEKMEFILQAAAM